MASIEVDQIPIKGRGGDASVLYGMSTSSRNYVLTMLNQGMTLEEALRSMADKVARPVQRPMERKRIANPFSSS